MFQVAILVFMFSEIRGRTSPAISTDWLHSVALSNPDLKMPATRGLSLRPKGDPCEKLFQNWRALVGRQFQTRRSSESRNTTAKSASGEVCNLQQTPQAHPAPGAHLLPILLPFRLTYTYWLRLYLFGRTTLKYFLPFTAGQQNYGQLRLYHSNVFIH